LKHYSPLHDIIHIAGIGMMTMLLWKLLPTWWERNFFFLACFLAVIGSVYRTVNLPIIKSCFLIGILFFLGSHILFNYGNMEQQVPHYLATAVVFAMTIVWNKTSGKERIFTHLLNTLVAVYLLIIGSMYIHTIVPNTFAITIFRWIVSVILLVLWIFNNKLTQRTLWLYVLLLVLLKIFCFDLRYGLDNALSRVIVFILLGSLLIFVSTRYSKKYGDNLTGEINIENLYR
jgi:hypothetical protein